MRSILGKLFGTGDVDRAIGGSRVVHFPDDFRSPGRLAVLSGPSSSDAWPALYLSRNLQRTYPETELTVICRAGDGCLFEMLNWKPRVVPYVSKPSHGTLEEAGVLDAATVLFHPYLTLEPWAVSFLSSSRAGIRVSPSTIEHPSLNVRVLTGSTVYPDIVHRLCSALGIQPDTVWRPMIPAELQSRVSSLMAPVSGRTLPYIAATARTVGILEKNRAEVPLRTVTVAGKNAELGDLDRETMVAIVTGASAVMTDDAGLWSTARAMGVPVAGLDTSGSFIQWSGDSPAANERDFVENWAELLRRGW